ncbi:hypothetical protein [Lentiprolixibacter aurantiacus]|uniref:Uncharacterized protein n=1 Tax=Lentiprolixibacter aurantiacus TaxID=2993939 RepID=A0AAE3MMC6_9FLAO|nr:hypothetical protein [Lentiprolixibacter aurantiacus]MCX2720490.1 hypothetical protein [Lentiprolixibacter aurantiacus]
MKIHATYNFLLSGVMLFSFLWNQDPQMRPDESEPASRIEYFTFSNNGTPTKGKIYIPDSYDTNKNIPAIYLIDFTEQHFKLATDEFEKVIAGVEQLEGVEALVVSLEGIPDIDAEPDSYQQHYYIYKNLASFVDAQYPNNSSRTFIGKGSESGVVLMAMFLEDSKTSIFENFIATDPSGLYTASLIDLIEGGDFPQNKSGKKLHFSFSTSNDRNSCTRLINLIDNARYPWLQFESKEYTDSNYENTYPIAFAEGLQYVLGD